MSSSGRSIPIPAVGIMSKSGFVWLRILADLLGCAFGMSKNAFTCDRPTGKWLTFPLRKFGNSSWSIGTRSKMVSTKNLGRWIGYSVSAFAAAFAGFGTRNKRSSGDCWSFWSDRPWVSYFGTIRPEIPRPRMKPSKRQSTGWEGAGTCFLFLVGPVRREPYSVWNGLRLLWLEPRPSSRF